MKLRDAGIALVIALFVGWLALSEYGPSQKREKIADLELIEALEAEA